MIAVIADDLTGAAEIGGIGLQYGLKTEISTRVDPQPGTDLLVINTDSRSKPEGEAVAATQKAMEAVKALSPQLIYKKIDSVLRGHVLAEAKIQIDVLGVNRALIVPANPYLHRKIVNGTYYFKDEPIHRSSFANDPEFAITSSDVKTMLRAKNGEVQVIALNTPLPINGISIGEVADMDDLDVWAAKADNNTALVGAAGFFTAILRHLSFKPQNGAEPAVTGKPVLFVCGTTFHKSREAVQLVKQQGGPVACLDISEEGLSISHWAKETATHLQNKNKAIMAFNAEPITKELNNAAHLRQRMAEGVAAVFDQTPVSELIIEGGSTAAAILKELNINRLYPAATLAPGVIRMGTDYTEPLYITMKPGSYDWPEHLWDF